MDEFKQTRYINEKRIVYVTAWNHLIAEPDVYMIDWDSTDLVIVSENSFALSSTSQRQLPILTTKNELGSNGGVSFQYFNVSTNAITNNIQIETSPEKFCCSVLSPDRTKLVYSSNSNIGELSIIDLASNERNTITTQSIDGCRPKFSLTGRFLAFAQNFGEYDSVMVYETATGKVRSIGSLRINRDKGSSALDWSYDSKEVIAVGNDLVGEPAVLGFRTDSSIVRTILKEQNKIYAAAYSPVGNSIAVATANSAYIVATDGTFIKSIPSVEVNSCIGKNIEWELGGSKMIIHHITGNGGAMYQIGKIEFIDLTKNKSSFPLQSARIINAHFPTVSMD